ncbi:hypothetical protein LQE92_10245 [Lacrimispora sp. NSJ-141]|uniref:Uncharacterized protein n=1 Tax=Lientehia hominis TaxID=2897778 RepID=A0AAP2RKD6_9FIRM|nr:hypothetical protein [Lientehia hominis]MCD2493008.1 hypothetical protein [Lientehia hominis]
MELLEYLRIQTDCAYISDLRGSTRFHSIKNAIDHCHVQQYSLREWNDAVEYITGKAILFSKAEEAAECLKSYLGSRASIPATNR